MLLKLLTWQEVTEYLRKRTDVIVPVGSTEQHGPNGPCGTDLIAAEELALELGEDRRALVAPTIPFGVSTAHMAFPGTLSLRPMTMVAMVRDVLFSLAQHGLRRFFIVNGHPGSEGALEAACAQVHADVAESRCVVVNWWDLPEVRSILLELFGAREGHHATPGELSLVKKFYPRGVPDAAPIERFEPLPTAQVYSASDFRRRYPDGRVGSDPSLATSGAGDRIFAAAAHALLELHKRMVDEA